MESRLLEILVCPTCKGPLRYERAQQELICQAERLAYPIRDGVPVMLPNEARSFTGTSSSDSAKSAAHAPAHHATDAAAHTHADQPTASVDKDSTQSGSGTTAQPKSDENRHAGESASMPAGTPPEPPSSDKPASSQAAGKNEQP